MGGIRIGNEGPTSAQGLAEAEEARRTGKSEGKGRSGSTGVVVEGSDQYGAGHGHGALGLEDVAPAPDHKALGRVVDAATHFHHLKRGIERKANQVERKVRWEAREDEHKIEHDVSHLERKGDWELRKKEHQAKQDIHTVEHEAELEIEKIERKVRRPIREARLALRVLHEGLAGSKDLLLALPHLEHKIKGDKALAQTAQAAQAINEAWKNSDATGITIEVSSTGKSYADGSTVYLSQSEFDQLQAVDPKVQKGAKLGPSDMVGLKYALADVGYTDFLDANEPSVVQDARAVVALGKANHNAAGTGVTIEVSNTGKAYSDGSTVYLTPDQIKLLKSENPDTFHTGSPPYTYSQVKAIQQEMMSPIIDSHNKWVEPNSTAAQAMDTYAAVRSAERYSANVDGIGDDINFETSTNGQIYAEGNTVYLPPATFTTLQNAGVPVKPGENFSGNQCATLQKELLRGRPRQFVNHVHRSSRGTSNAKSGSGDG